ncbi:MAG: hypothetical protein BGO49_24415 [Planctomycetales bacterium 71-10]|nr:MAG: hypothetical protein BGO49_24415 [Planctomycetales bacterium 71-10]
MADYQYIAATGVILPQTSDILSGVQQEYRDAFGADLVVTPDTPQGVLITAEALARAEVVRNNADLANQINPNVAGGVFLDAIMALTGMQRTPATKTVVPAVTLSGVAGTVIAAGALAATAAGDRFASLSTVTLDGAGSATVDFAAVEYGPVPCGAGDLTTVVSGILGWETVTNPNAGVLGSAVQSDQAARALRRNTLAFQGVALAEAITSALYNVEGVRSLAFRENVAATTQVIDGISMVGHSIYACVDGGSDTDVAAALLENKSSGCAWNGGTNVSVVEPASGQSYAVQFDRPEVIGVLIKVTTTNGDAGNITKAILDYAAGDIDGLAGFVVGADVSPFEIAGAVMAEQPGYYISKVEISRLSPVSYSTAPIAIGINQIAHTQLSYITVVIA